MQRFVDITSRLISNLRKQAEAESSEPVQVPFTPNCLLVEDVSRDAELSLAALHALNVPTMVARTGEDAIRLLKKSKDSDHPDFQIVFLDLVLVGSAVQGVEVLQFIRTNFPSIHTILVSGHIDNSILAMINAYSGRGGYIGFVTKPLEEMDIREIFAKHHLPLL